MRLGLLLTVASLYGIWSFLEKGSAAHFYSQPFVNAASKFFRMIIDSMIIDRIFSYESYNMIIRREARVAQSRKTQALTKLYNCVLALRDFFRP